MVGNVRLCGRVFRKKVQKTLVPLKHLYKVLSKVKERNMKRQTLFKWLRTRLVLKENNCNLPVLLQPWYRTQDIDGEGAMSLTVYGSCCIDRDLLTQSQNPVFLLRLNLLNPEDHHSPCFGHS